MVTLFEVVDFLDAYLRINTIEDDSWNGLQIQGKPNISKIAFAVDAGLETFEKAAELNVDMVVVHHGQFWRDVNPSIVGYNKERLDVLLKNDVSLYVAHVPLDCHEFVGNNKQLIKLLGAVATEGFCSYKGRKISWIGKFSEAADLSLLIKKLETELNTKCIILPFGKSRVESVAVCSGGGEYSHFFEASQKKVDLYITGDTSDIYQAAKDAGINVIFAGHHDTETVGLKALAIVLAEKLNVETVFIDLPTGL